MRHAAVERSALRMRSRRRKHLAAGRRKARHGLARPRLFRHRRWLGMEHGLGEPRVELLAAAITSACRRLRLAFGAVARAAQADVEVVVVPPPRPQFLEPGAVAAGLAAQRFLDGRIDEYPL